MAVALRLIRKGSKHRPFYHLVAICSRKRRSFLEQLGSYDPLTEGEGSLRVDVEAAGNWLAKGAQPSPVVRKLFKRAGVGRAAPAVAAAAAP